MERISLKKIVANPLNPRTITSGPEIASLEALKNSITTMPIPGSLAEPIQLVPLTQPIVDAFFGGKFPAGISEEKPEFMIMSGHRRYAVFVDLAFKSAKALVSSNPTLANKLAEDYGSIPANVSKENISSSDAMLRSWAANENRVAPDIKAKAKVYMAIKLSFAMDELLKLSKKTNMTAAERDEKLAELKETYMNRKTGAGSNAQIGAIMGMKGSSMTRFEQFAAFPERLQDVFVELKIPEALIGAIVPRIKDGDFSYDDVITWLTSKKDEKSRTWEILSKEIKSLAPGGTIVKDGDVEEEGDGEKKKKGASADPKEKEAASEARKATEAYFNDQVDGIEAVASGSGITFNFNKFMMSIVSDLNLKSKDRELLAGRLERLTAAKAKVTLPDSACDVFRNILTAANE